MKLPQVFIEKMQALLGAEEWQSFLASYTKERCYGLRVNTLKLDRENLCRKLPFQLEAIPWTQDGFYYDALESPGKHPYYHMGLYYIQEPSAMLPAAVLNPQPGEKVLDLCAAPGGKTVQLAASMKNQGLLVSNDISASRIKALIKNIELFGLKNCVVTNEAPANLAKNFGGYFDRILVDAPCSGEGMFRKDPEAIKSYDAFKPQKCEGMQREILKEADKMLKTGGLLMYATCTFNPDENERMIQDFCVRYGYEWLEIPKAKGVSSGRPQWADENQAVAKSARIWPHLSHGEGHFAALLRKMKASSGLENERTGKLHSLDLQLLAAYRRFEKENLRQTLQGNFFSVGKHLYFLPASIPDFRGIKVSKFGLFLGEWNEKTKQLEASHSFLLTLGKAELLNSVSLGIDSVYLKKYLHGETLILEELLDTASWGKNLENPLVALCVDEFPVGWGKLQGHTLKNLYPKGWRMLS